MASRSFTIRVPATSANIGPGFDVVGLSLSLYLTLTVTVKPPTATTPAAPPVITYSGEGADEVPLDAYKNLTTRVALYVLRCHGIVKFPSNLSIHCAPILLRSTAKTEKSSSKTLKSTLKSSQRKGRSTDWPQSTKARGSSFLTFFPPSCPFLTLGG